MRGQVDETLNRCFVFYYASQSVKTTSWNYHCGKHELCNKLKVLELTSNFHLY